MSLGEAVGCDPGPRFWSKVRKTDTCWLWTGAKHKFGYGMFGVTINGQRSMRGAHRIVLESILGPLPSNVDACHSCDVPACVNPGHLFSGSRSENIRDCTSKKRHAFGEKSGNAKLTETDVISIHVMWSRGGMTQGEIARSYGVGQEQISRILSGKRWAHLKPTPVSA